MHIRLVVLVSECFFVAIITEHFSRIINLTIASTYYYAMATKTKSRPVRDSWRCPFRGSAFVLLFSLSSVGFYRPLPRSTVVFANTGRVTCVYANTHKLCLVSWDNHAFDLPMREEMSFSFLFSFYLVARILRNAEHWYTSSKRGASGHMPLHAFTALSHFSGTATHLPE